MVIVHEFWSQWVISSNKNWLLKNGFSRFIILFIESFFLLDVKILHHDDSNSLKT